jgi:hypothetical protein
VDYQSGYQVGQSGYQVGRSGYQWDYQAGYQ